MTTFSWHTPEYEHQEKTQDWYWTIGIITAAIVIVLIILGDALFGVVLAIGTFSLMLLSSRKPPVVQIEVSNKGIKVGKTLYPYPSLEAFGIDEEHKNGPRLHLKSKRAMMPLITIPVLHDGMDDLRVFLREKLKEETFEESILHNILEQIGL